MTEAPTRRLVQGAMSLGTASFLGMALSLLGTMIVTRHFSAEVFGAYTLLRVVVTFLGQVSSFGLGMSLAKFISGAEDPARRQTLISTAMIFRLLATLVFSAAAWLARPWLALLFGSDMLADLFVFMPVLFLLESSLAVLKAILQGFLLFNRVALTDLSMNALNLVLIVVVVLFLRADIFGLIVARAFALFIPCILAYLWIPLKKRLSFGWEELKQLIAFGFPLQLNDILSFIYSRIDTLIIAAFLGPADIAFYEVGRRIPDTLHSLAQSIWSVYFPIMARLFAFGEARRAAHLLNDTTRLFSAAGLLGTAAVLLWSQDLIRLLFSERYLPSAPIFTLLMASLSISLVGGALGTSLVAIGESNKPPLVNLVHTTLSLLGNLVLIPAFGITGAALVSLIGPSATNPFNVFFLRRKKLEVKVNSYLKPFLVFGPWAALVLWLQPSDFVGKTGLFLLLPALFIIFTVVTLADLRAFWSDVHFQPFTGVSGNWFRTR